MSLNSAIPSQLLPLIAALKQQQIDIELLVRAQIELDPEFSVGTHSTLYATCPECKLSKDASPSLEVHLFNGDWLCYHCFFHGNAFAGRAKKHKNDWIFSSPNIPKAPLARLEHKGKFYNYLHKLGISDSTIDHFAVSSGTFFFSKAQELRSALIFPYFVDSVHVNNAYYQNNKNSQFLPGAVESFYNLNAIDDDCTIIVEGELDVLALHECGFLNVIGIPFTPAVNSKNYEDQFSFLLHAEDRLTNVKKIILATSFTESGLKIQEELARRLGKERCWRAFWSSDYINATMTLSQHGREHVIAAIDGAKIYPIQGIFEASDVSDKIDSLYQYGLPPGVKPGWPSLDQYYTVKEGQWTLVTGIPGHGKSNLLDAMLVNIAENENWRFGMFSPENQPIERHFANLMEKYSDAPFSFNSPGRMSEELLEHSKKWVDDHFYVILPDDTLGNWTVDGILSLAKALVFRKGIKGLVLDPWNELDHTRSNGMTETEHISQSLTKIRQFARSYGVHVWVVAHPAKLFKDADGFYPVPTPYDVSGSSHWNNKADNAISIWRNRGGLDEEITDVHVQKIRFKEVGRVGVAYLRYKKDTGRFIDDIDQDLRDKAKQNKQISPTSEFIINSSKVQSKTRDLQFQAKKSADFSTTSIIPK